MSSIDSVTVAGGSVIQQFRWLGGTVEALFDYPTEDDSEFSPSVTVRIVSDCGHEHENVGEEADDGCPAIRYAGKKFDTDWFYLSMLTTEGETVEEFLSAALELLGEPAYQAVIAIGELVAELKRYAELWAERLGLPADLIPKI